MDRDQLLTQSLYPLRDYRYFLDPEWSLSATTVVLVLVVTLFEKCLTQRKVTKLRIHIREIIRDRSIVLDFYQMAPPSGSVVPFVLFYPILKYIFGFGLDQVK